MNDQHSGQLCGAWTIPVYARGLLWIDSEAGAVAVEGDKGLFTLPAPADMLTLRWGGADGAVLARLPWRVDSLDWDGTIRLGGFFDTIHMAASGEIEGGIMVMHLAAYPLKPTSAPYPVARGGALMSPNFYDGIDDSVGETFTTWIATDDSPALTLAQDALVTKLQVWCFGRLTADKARWHERFALPIWLNEMTVFAP
ncbi:MAG: hypothetical protein SGJ24_13675 [Chloroflexota bacterium]|nr:hypothetical protein [Chloroflexota bacterium]